MHRNGISLIELSIVLVVIGLITGSVMVGASLIRNSEVKSVITLSQKYKTAMVDFRIKYANWPGDMVDATQYWGVRDGATGNNDTCYDAGTTSGITTCNGNGDGIIWAGYSAVYASERYQAWQHLANAGLIEGTYTGFGGTTAVEVQQPDVNVPSSPISNSFFLVYTVTPLPAGNAHYFPRDKYSTGVFFNATTGVPLTPEEAWNVDMKIDDGFPANGAIYTFKQTSTWTPNCANGDTTAAQYNLSDTVKRCVLHFEAE